jgi:DNA processing protein
MVTILEPNLPPLLKETPQPPHLLYVKGNAACLTNPSVAIVGTRAITPYGEKTCAYITAACVRAGLTIVSGLATGVDAVAHQTTLELGGTTIAVLGSGLDPTVLFPAGHRSLAQRIIKQNGALVSEYPATTLARRHYFLARNRILAGLSLATIVIEASYQSGAINTAHHAIEANRLVYAVPGSIFSPRSAGTHRLLQAGASILYRLEDLFAELKLSAPTTLGHSKIKPPPLQQQLVQCLQSTSLTSEQLAEFTGYSCDLVQAALTELEIQGIVRKNIWMLYELIT